MIGEGTHFEFIAFAYAGVAILTLALIGYVIYDQRRVKAKLDALEKSGVRRRSAGPAQ